MKPSDPFLLDHDQLAALSSGKALRNAVRYANAHRVVSNLRDGASLQGEVEDETDDELYCVELHWDADAGLTSACDCVSGHEETDGAPGGEESSLCVHALALLIDHAKEPVDGQLVRDAQVAALEERIARGRAEVQVAPLTAELLDEVPVYGTWSARSVQSTTHFPVSYRVHVRSLAARANYCTCPDFATNQLGTCKHIEAVVHRIDKLHPRIDELKRQPPPVGYVYLDWEAERAPRIRLHRGAATDPALEPLLDDYFDASGDFRGRPAEDFPRFAARLGERPDLLIGDDAAGYARRLAEDASREVRARAIGEQIRAGGGQLPGVRARLYPYQVEGVAFLAGHGRALLADDMGLGKTLQAIAAAYWLHRHEQVERVLIVCPASLKLQWAREIEKFTGERARIIQGPIGSRQVQYSGGRGFFVVNYELVMRDLTVINERLRPDLLILDEAQRIKNWRTKIASAVKRVGSRYAFVLTGTPLENRLEDLYSLMQAIDARVLGPLWRYMVDFHITDERGKVLGYRNLSELRRRLKSVMLRRDRTLVRDQLPERIETRIDLELTAAQQDIHDDAVSAAARLAQIMKRRPLTPSEQNRMMAALQRARMACDAAELVDEHSVGSPKLDELETILTELCVNTGLKAVVFSQWERMTALAERRARALGLGTVRLHGGVPTVKRGALMDAFREDDSVQVFLSTDAGGVGLNLQNAAVLVNLDIPWNPAVLDQRIARVHRLGQTQKVQILLLVAAGSYEEHVLSLVQGKRHLFDNVVDPDATEEVVGVSKRLAEVLAEDLATTAEADPDVRPESAAETAGEQAPEAPAELADSAPPNLAQGQRSGENAAHNEAVRQAVLGLQQRFGIRIERILGTRPRQGLAGGLLLVLDQVSAEDDRLAAEITTELPAAVPVALIDKRTLASLNRLGDASPVADSEPLYEPPPQSQPNAASALLVKRARDNLEASGVLAEHGRMATAMELLMKSLLAAACLRTGREEAPTAQTAGVWLHTEVLPSGVLSAAEGALLTRALSLAHSGDALPPALLAELIDETRVFVEQATGMQTGSVSG
ncbi:DEAD/DEAH box helicase [Thiorhodovibrio frisius]|uniref:DNA/RNA helicase, superfamily II, SNF2 family n=1 Tax=Thiorhodovibrio frisius TaxID=631362 RepID=H8Z6G8_9GAMM|nr:DEAD/DEAH box helicase [Thiorhodovibrio frisius]EIC19666.1 DNA/RNA helicase, superfamily II, SNF2 family [Thiorhodovibrio frisius]WPL20366.1 RNA polymerase-associated protein RapA [Thiorhodovibrio frisius]